MPTLEAIFAAMDTDPAAADTENAMHALAEHAGQNMRGRILTSAAAVRFMTAGNARFTLKSKKTGERFTYRVATSEDGRMRFVSVLSGPDNESDYRYFGHVQVGREIFWHGRKAKISEDAPSARAFAWAWRQLNAGNMPEQLEFWHEGRCGRCARPLTDPASIAQGYGPECITKVGVV